MSKSTLSTALVAAILIVLAFALNPSPEKHRSKIKEAIAERSPLAGVLGVGALAAFVSNYHSLGVASYATVNEQTVSIGAYGMVFVRDLSPQK